MYKNNNYFNNRLFINSNKEQRQWSNINMLRKKKS